MEHRERERAKNVFGSDQGAHHAPANLTDDICAPMESLHENEIYQIKDALLIMTMAQSKMSSPWDLKASVKA